MIKLIKNIFIFFIICFLLIFSFKKEYFINKFKYIIISNSNYTGMFLNEVHLIGRKYETKDNIIDALQVDIGEPINSFNIIKIRQRINNLSWVKDSKIFLRPLGKLDIVVFEYIPFGVSKYKKLFYLIDSNGLRFKAIKSSEFPEIFRLHGEGATFAIKELQPIIQKLRQLSFNVIKIERVDIRRWDIFTKEGFVIKLPNINPINSIDFLYPLKNINYSELHSIDLRIKDRISLKYNKKQ